MNLVELARESDFSLGTLKVRPSLRQTEAGGESETLEPRVMQVLVALRQRRGEVISRDELIQRCWGGRIVGEDAITRAIVRLRKLGETSGAFGIETIPRVGYRLLVTDAGQPDPPGNMALPAGDPPVRPRQRTLLIAATGTLAILLVALAVWPRSPIDPVTIDVLVDRLADRAAAADMAAGQRAEVGEVIRLLSTGRSEERSAFAALMSGDGERALDLLDALARGLEENGQREAAAEVYARIGAIALVVDRSRGLAARRKALSLSPESLNAFQGLLFDLLSSGNSSGIEQLVGGMLASDGISEQMRAWVLMHRGLYEVDRLVPDMEAVRKTLAEIDTIRREYNDPVIELSWRWLQSLIAFNQDDFRTMGARLAEVEAIWRELPETNRIQDVAETGRLRALYASGDWAGTLERGSAIMDQRSRRGEFLPTPVIMATCMAGIHGKRVDAAAPYCLSMTRHLEVTAGIGIMPEVYSSVLKAALGDERGARLDLDAAKVILGPDSLNGFTLAPNILMAEAYLAQASGDLDAARRLVEQAVQQVQGPPGRMTWRSFAANGAQLVGEWMIAGGRAADACEPLAEASNLYADLGIDASVTAMAALRHSAGCDRGTPE